METTREALPAIDMDGHVVEPGDLYRRYVEPRYRDAAIEVRRERDGLNHYRVKGRPHGLFPVLPPAEPGMWSRLGRLPPAQRGAAWLRELQRDWTDSLPAGSLDPTERLRVMDAEGIDASLLFPTLGLSWEEDVLDDPDYTFAHLRAYNTWVAEYCSVDPRRLLFAAHVSLRDPDACVAEIERCARAGARAVLLRAVAVGPHPPSHRHFDRVWSAIQDHDLLLALHIFAPPRTVVNWGRQGRQSLFRKVIEVFPNLLGLSDLILGGVLERHPRLRLACVEQNSAWFPYLFAGMDEKARSPQTSDYHHSLLPSELFERQGWLTPDPHERFAFVTRHVPVHKLLFSTDYPHSESEPDVAERWRERVAGLPERQRSGFLRDNALACLGDPEGRNVGRAA